MSHRYRAQDWVNGTGESVQVSMTERTARVTLAASEKTSNNLLLPGIVDLHAVIQPLTPDINECQVALENGITCLLAMPRRDTDNTDVFYPLPAYDENKQIARAYQSIPISTAYKDTKVPLDYVSIDKDRVKALLITDQDLLHTKALLRCLQLARESKIRVFMQPNWAPLCQNGHVHQGTLATVNGLDGISPSAETIALTMVLELIRDTGTPLHCTGITSARSIVIIEQAKKEGLPVTADVPITHLLFSDNDIGNFDTRYKLWPPLRSVNDKQALLEGMATGIIDAVTSFHTPQTYTSKHLPFASASYGASTFDTFVPMLVQLLNSGSMTPEMIRQCCSINPSDILGIDNPHMIIIDPESNRSMDANNWLSAGYNSPWFQKADKAYGKVIMISR